MNSSSLTQKTAVKPTVSIGVVVEITAGGDTATLRMEKTQEGGTSIFRGGMTPGQKLRLGALLEDAFEITALTSMSGLTITELTLEMRPALNTYAFQMGVTNAWLLEIETSSEPLKFSVDRVFVALKKSPQEISFFLQGDFSLLGGKFSLAVSRIVTTTPAGGEWSLLARAKDIQLAPLVNKLLGEGKLTSDFGLDTLTIQALELELIQKTIVPQGGGQATTNFLYHFYGAINWAFTIADEPINVLASADIKNYTESIVAGKKVKTQAGIAGIVAGTISLFEKTVEASIFYEFSSANDNKIEFRIKIKSFTLKGLYEKKTIQRTTSEVIDFTFSLVTSVKIGDLISYVVSLFDPSLEDFELDAPWDALGNQLITNDDLSKLTARIDLTNSQFTFNYASSVDFVFFTVSGIGLSYGKIPGSNQYRPNISLNLVIPGQAPQQTAWDPVNENPPSIPGKGVQIFDLQFLAIGQRVSFHPDIVAKARNINQVMTVLRQTMGVLPPAQRRQNPLQALQDPLPSPVPVSIDPTTTITLPAGTSPIVFDPNSGILLGAQFTIMDTLDMSVIFNDPLIYGLRVSLYGAKAKMFAGLQFEILYRRVSDTVGVYHVELAMPESMRQFDVGALTVTLPTIVVDIYTNGDFAIDFGFPWKGDFTRSFAIQGFAGPFPILGFGGFYFAKLSAETATSTPLIVNGTFSPVYEFGLGFKLGLGRTFNKGPLTADISITIQGVIQGVVARFNPSDPTVASDDYFKIQGGVSLVGRLYGIVDFGVISVQVEVLIRATILFVVEAYQPTQLILEAEVTVRASIKILFVRVSFSFSLTLRESFTLGSAKPTPWKLDTRQPQAAIVDATPRAAAFVVAAPSRQIALDAEVSEQNEAEPAALSMPTAVDAETPERNIAEPPLTRRVASGAEALERDNVGSATFTTRGVDQSGAVTPTNLAAPATDWTPVKLALPKGIASEQIFQERIRIDLYFQPGFTQVTHEVAGQVKHEVAGVGLLFIENSIQEHDDPNKVGLSAATVNTDFDELVKALLKWTVYNYRGIGTTHTGVADFGYDFYLLAIAKLLNNQYFRLLNFYFHTLIQQRPHTLALADWEDVYNRFIKEFETANHIPHFLRQLYLFLAENFVFNISDRVSDDPKQQKECSGTFFPMLPKLELSLDDAAPIKFQANEFKRSLAQIQQIKNYLKALQVRPGSTIENSVLDSNPSESISVGETRLSLTEYLFADYFLLLIRSGIQSAIDHLEKEETSSVPVKSVESILAALNTNGAFNHLAGTASRYFLHGLRLPTPTTGQQPQDWPTTALYAAIGQQFNVSITTQRQGEGEAATRVTTVNLKQIKLSNPNKLSWVRFLDYGEAEPPIEPNTEGLTYVLNEDQKTFLTQLEEATPNLPTQINRLPFYRSAPRQYTLRQRVTMPGGTLWTLPTDLRAYLQTDAEGSGQSQEVFFSLTDSMDKKAAPLASDQVVWATKIKVTVRRLATKNVYQLVGTDEVGKDLLEAIRGQGGTPRLDLLYLDSTQLSQAMPDVSLLKTNLSTSSQSSAKGMRILEGIATADSETYRATLPDPTNGNGSTFLQLLWECSTVNSGGYYLAYGPADRDGLPDTLFTDGVTAELVLVIHLADQTQQVYPFHNCVKITSKLSDAQADLLATRVDQHNNEVDPVQVLQMPAGYLGVQITRPYVEIDPKNDTANDELENLYQLLGYRLLEQVGKFIATPEGLPIGPSDDASDPKNLKWQYERVIPVYQLVVNPPKQTDTTLPSPAKNPYLGVGKDAEVKLQMEWRDLYGNTLTPFQPKPLPVRYFDPLLGLNQWPGLIGRYWFSNEQEQPPQTTQLTLSFQLDTSQYIPTPSNRFEEVQRKTRAAREIYQQVFYQIHQTDVTATVQTSVLLQDGKPVQTEILDQARTKPQLPDFVNAVYRYLTTLEGLTLLEHTVQANETFTKIAGQYRVSIDNLAQENQQRTGLWPDGTILKIPVERDIAPDDRLGAIVDAVLRVEGQLQQPVVSKQAKITEIVSLHENTPGLVLAGRSLPKITGGGSYKTQPGDSLAQIAAATGQTVTTLVQTLEAQQDNYLDDKVTLSVPLTYRYKSTDSLADIRDQVKAVFDHTTLTIDLDAKLLTVTDLALATDAVLLTGTPPTLTLAIPGHLNLAEQDLPSQAKIGPGDLKLLDLVQTLNRDLTGDPQKWIDIAAVVTTNQTLTGLIKADQSLQQALESWLALDENVPTSLRNQVQSFLNAVTNKTTREHETFYSLTNTFEQVRQALVDTLASAPVPTDPLLKTQVQQVQKRLSRRVSLAEVAIAIQDLLLNSDATLIVPPYTLEIPLALALPGKENDPAAYPNKLIFPVTVQVTLQRQDTLVSNAVPDRDLVKTSTAYLSPHTVVEGDAPRSASLAGFAQDFQAAFVGLRLATSDNRNPGFPGDPNGPSQSIWAVRLGEGGLTYTIAPSAPPNNPLFFAPYPLANTLMAGMVDLEISTDDERQADGNQPDNKRFDAIDLNLLAQNFLQAVEDFLSPKVSIPAVRLGATEAAAVDTILNAKEALAEAISGQVVPLLALDPPPQPDQVQAAAEALKQELKINLAEAYAIETIVQYGVTITNPHNLSHEGDWPVRLAGQPTLERAQNATKSTEIDRLLLDFTLSPAKVSLEPTTYLTFFFNTQNPEKYEDIELNLTFNTNELEYNIKDVDGIEGYQSSDWLSFLVQNAPVQLGSVQIPIPLRTYPIPPSLVLQRAELDPDAAGDDLANIRQWQYVYTYEHLDVAQDSLESDVRYNLLGLPDPAALGIVEDSAAETLFDTLVRFNQKYPEIQKLFEQLADADTSVKQDDAVTTAIKNFATLVTEVARTWATWQPPALASSGAIGVDYTINEEEPPVSDGQPAIKEVTIVAPIRNPDPVTLPQVVLPGYRLDSQQDSSSDVQQRLYRFSKKSPEEAALDPIYGESSIPDRTLIIQDRDIIAHQNAWSGIWLTRNRQLVPTAATNPAFVFQTPQVRFSNWVTPLLVNRRPWNIADLSSSSPQSLFIHLKRLFETVLPPQSANAYGLRLDCRYAFAITTAGDDEQLFSTVPVLLTPRIAISANEKLTNTLLANDENGGLVKALAREIYDWRNRNNPVANQGRYQFTLNLFSGLVRPGTDDTQAQNLDPTPTLPILKIEQLFVKQSDINWDIAEIHEKD